MLKALAAGRTGIGAPWSMASTRGRPCSVPGPGGQRPPASVEKLYTTVALMRALGPDTRLHAAVLGEGGRLIGATWHGDLYLRGGGDPTFGDSSFNRVWNGGFGPTRIRLAGQLRRRGITGRERLGLCRRVAV